jgi:hypothetical protein
MRDQHDWTRAAMSGRPSLLAFEYQTRGFRSDNSRLPFLDNVATPAILHHDWMEIVRAFLGNGIADRIVG